MRQRPRGLEEPGADISCRPQVHGLLSEQFLFGNILSMVRLSSGKRGTGLYLDLCLHNQLGG
jgi:hypothetical protein